MVKFLGIDRGTVFQFSPDMARMSRTHSYAEEGILSSPLNYQTEALPWTAEKLQRGELVLFEKIEDLPAEAGIDRQVS